MCVLEGEGGVLDLDLEVSVLDLENGQKKTRAESTLN